MEGPKILYSMITKDDIILVEHNLYKADLTKKIVKNLLKEVKKDTSSLISKDDYNFAYLNEDSITYALLTTNNFNKATVVGFIESIKKAFDLSFHQKDFQNIREYGLNDQFQKTLIEKMDLFNANPECASEEIIIEREKLSKQTDEFIALFYSNLDRIKKIMPEKRDDLSRNSLDFYKLSKIKNKKCKCKCITLQNLLKIIC